MSLFKACLIIVSLMVAAPMAHAQKSSFSDTERQNIEAIIKDYLLKKPEVLQEALIELDRRQQDAQKNAQKQALSEEKEALFSPARAFVAGNEKGDVTIVEFFDYNCGFCKKALSDMQALLKKDPNIRLILKDFPVLGPDSVEASRVALAAKQQLKGAAIWDYHMRVMELKGRVNGERALGIAKDMGLDVTRLQKDMASLEVKTLLENNARLGDKLNLTGTPAFVIGQEIVFGAVGLEALTKVVEGVRQCGKASC
jgi:protein-disulfide isomerase